MGRGLFFLGEHSPTCCCSTCIENQGWNKEIYEARLGRDPGQHPPFHGRIDRPAPVGADLRRDARPQRKVVSGALAQSIEPTAEEGQVVGGGGLGALHSAPVT